MATIKSFTSLKQSRKLAEILPLESADYTRLGKDEDNVLTRPYFESCSSRLGEWIGKDEMYPCWSLASLLEVIPDGLVNRMTENSHKWEAASWNGIDFDQIHSVEGFDSPIDACYEMVLKLHELNLL